MTEDFSIDGGFWGFALITLLTIAIVAVIMTRWPGARPPLSKWKGSLTASLHSATNGHHKPKGHGHKSHRWSTTWKALKTFALVAFVISAFWWAPAVYAGVKDWLQPDPCMRPNSSINWANVPPGASGTMPSKDSGEYSIPTKRIPGFVNCVNLLPDQFVRRIDRNGDELYQSTSDEELDFIVRRVPETR